MGAGCSTDSTARHKTGSVSGASQAADTDVPPSTTQRVAHPAEQAHAEQPAEQAPAEHAPAEHAKIFRIFITAEHAKSLPPDEDRDLSTAASSSKGESEEDRSATSGAPELPPCRFGASCYNRSAQHRARFAHPVVEEAPACEPSAAARWQVSDTSVWPRTWADLDAEESAAVEKGFAASGGRGTHRTGACDYSFKHWTAQALGSGKRRVAALRRLQDPCSGVVTHPPPSGGPQVPCAKGGLAEIHPLDRWQIRKKQPADPGDWLSNDFFFSCFLSALRSLRLDTTEYEKPGKMYEWFDFRANVDWRAQTEVRTHTRGGLAYVEPNGFYGFAVNVLGKYDGGNNDWMKLEGNPGEWAVAYHGTKVDGFPQILTSGFRAGAGQAYRSHRCVKTGAPIGTGVYCTPGLPIAEGYAGEGHDFNGRKIIFVMQCRVNPAKIKHCHDYATNPNAYWVLNDPKDIRPYRVLIKAK